MTAALEDGAWVRAGAVMVWQPRLVPVPRQVDVHTLIACPSCHARVDETCKTASGHTTTPHASRLAPRLCPCGADLAARRRLCDPCARQSAQRSKNEHGRRRYMEKARERARRVA